jgi:hypothetical protein
LCVRSYLKITAETIPPPPVAMARVWADVAGGIGTKLKVDYPTS